MNPVILSFFNGVLGGLLVGMISVFIHIRLGRKPVLGIFLVFVVAAVVVFISGMINDPHLDISSFAWAISVFSIRRILFKRLKYKDPLGI